MSIISLAEQDSHALLKYKSIRGSWEQNHYVSNSKCNDGNIKWDSNVTDPFYHYDPIRPKDYNAVTMNLHDPYA